MKKLLFSAFILCLIILSVEDAFACSCELPFRQPLGQQVKKAYKEAAAVFYGEVTEINRKPENFYVTVRIRVEKSWKNRSEKEVIIQTGIGDGDCGYKFEIGGKYLVYAYKGSSGLGTNICQRTSASDADSEYLDKIKRPVISQVAKENNK